MDIDNLVKNANQIARFFEAWTERDAAANEVANHLRRFWSPRMRDALIERVLAGTDEGHIAPLVKQAVSALAGDTRAVETHTSAPLAH